MKDASNLHDTPSLSELLHRKALSRRRFLGSALTLTGGAALASQFKAGTALAHGVSHSSLTFGEIPKHLDTNHAVAKNYDVDVLISWGDHLHDDDIFDPHDLTPETQARQFGYNNDFLAFMPITRGGNESNHGLLCVNHEYTNRYLMFEGLTSEQEKSRINVAQARVEMEAHGCSVVEIKKQGDQWNYVEGSRFNRRMTATTPMQISGDAAGHTDMQTSADPEGKTVLGTIGNCAGGVTPWGTILTAEENFDHHFSGAPRASHRDAYKRYGINTESYYHWYHADARFDLGKEPNEPNRFGWIVEYAPYNPEFIPVKRTALGRFKHECATTTLTPDGRVVVYSGDDEVFEYVYRFISDAKVDMDNPTANKDILDKGVLSVARFHDDDTMEWLPLLYGQNGLDESNGFTSQADICIYTRRAADIVGATPMDRPEDVEVNPVTGSVFIALTKNTERKETNSANPRSNNKYGHIIELTPPKDDDSHDHGAQHYGWDIFLQAGNPQKAKHQAYYQSCVSEHGWLANPDNVAFDGQGRIWIATDGQGKSIDKCDGLYAAECSGDAKGSTKLFFNAPLGAEICGPAFTPDSKTLFLSIQHPAEKPSTSSFNDPSTRWPDFDKDTPPRPSVIAITHKNDKIIGS